VLAQKCRLFFRCELDLTAAVHRQSPRCTLRTALI
jgi:hypothetical protein